MKARLQEVAEYYVAERRPIQAEFMALAYEYHAKPQNNQELIDDQIKVLATTLELIQTYFFFWDDLDDGAKERCGKPCWHVLPDTGLLALNDASLLRSLINETMEQNFDGELLKNLMFLYNRNFFICSMGQYYDTIASRVKDYNNFTQETYEQIVWGKSAFYSVKCPILVGLALANKYSPETYKIVDDVGQSVGRLVQVHNDLIDICNAEGTVTGKSGTDIQEGKCSWPAVAVLQKCNPAQRRVFEENYGSWEPERAARIQELYKELDIINLYREEVASCRDIFFRKVNALPKNSTPSAEFFVEFYNFFNTFTKDLTLMYDNH
ncbi:unnamed protein product, partial [Iphiclides podalirius]